MIKWLLFALLFYFLFRLIRSLLRISGFVQGISDNVNHSSASHRPGLEKDITDKVRRID